MFGSNSDFEYIKKPEALSFFTWRSFPALAALLGANENQLRVNTNAIPSADLVVYTAL